MRFWLLHEVLLVPSISTGLLNYSTYKMMWGGILLEGCHLASLAAGYSHLRSSLYHTCQPTLGELCESLLRVFFFWGGASCFIVSSRYDTSSYYLAEESELGRSKRLVQSFTSRTRKFHEDPEIEHVWICRERPNWQDLSAPHPGPPLATDFYALPSKRYTRISGLRSRETPTFTWTSML